MKSNAAWQIPFGLFYIVPVIVASLIWFVPESPRWLAMRDRPKDARKALYALREGKFTAAEIEAELDMILNNIKAEKEMERGTFFDMFKKPNLKRSMIVIVANFFLQSTGSVFASVYGAIFVKSLGTINQFTVTVTIASINTFICLVSMVGVDKVGRRVLLLIGASIQCAALMIMGSLGTVKNPSHAVLSGVVAMMIIFLIGFYVGWASIVHTLSAELPSSGLRDITYRTASIINIITQYVRKRKLLENANVDQVHYILLAAIPFER